MYRYVCVNCMKLLYEAINYLIYYIIVTTNTKNTNTHTHARTHTSTCTHTHTHIYAQKHAHMWHLAGIRVACEFKSGLGVGFLCSLSHLI